MVERTILAFQIWEILAQTSKEATYQVLEELGSSFSLNDSELLSSLLWRVKFEFLNSELYGDREIL